MEGKDRNYYAEILILVDGWPWNLSEFDFRRFFAAESCPQWLIPVADEGKTAKSRVSENRRHPEAAVDRRSRRKNKKQKRAAMRQPHHEAHRKRLEALARAVLITKAA